MGTLYPIGGAETPLDMYSARDLGAHHGAATAVAWSCTAHRLASGGVDGTVKIWAPEKSRPSYNANLQQQMLQGGQQRPPAAPERPVAEIRISAGSPSLESKAPSSSSAPSSREQLRARPPRVARLAWHPRRAEVLAVASDDGATVRLFDAGTGEALDGGKSSSPSARFVSSFTPPAPMPRCTAISLAWCPSPLRPSVVAVGTDADIVSFHDVSPEGGGRVLAMLPPPLPGTEVNEAVFSADGTVFARAVGTGGAVELFSVEELLSSPLSSTDAVPSTPSEWKRVRAAAKPFATLRGHTSTVFALSTVANAAYDVDSSSSGTTPAAAATGPAAHLLASGGADGAAVVWDLRFGGAPLATCGSFDSQVKSVSLGGGWSWNGSRSNPPPSSPSSSPGSMIAYAGEGDVVVLEDWTRAPRTGGFLPPRPPTAPHLSSFNPRPYPLRVYVPRVESVAWAPAVAPAGGGDAAPKSSAASGPSPPLDRRPPSPRSASSAKLRGSSSAPRQANVGALAFTRCFQASSPSQAICGEGSGAGRSADVVGAVGLFAPPPAPSSSR